MRTLPNGELVYVNREESDKEALENNPATQMPSTTSAANVAGRSVCPHCQVAFTSDEAMQHHIRNDHAIASGQADMRPITLPDGTEVPAETVPELVEDYEKRQREMEERMAELEAELARESAEADEGAGFEMTDE